MGSKNWHFLAFLILLIYSSLPAQQHFSDHHFSNSNMHFNRDLLSADSMKHHSPFKFGEDKGKHFVVSLFLTAFSYNIAKTTFNAERKDAKFAAVGFSLSIGVGKEVRDHFQKNNRFNWWDLFADVLGIGVGYCLINQQ